MTEKIPQFKHPPMFEIIGSTIPSDEVNRRLQKVFEKLPRLWSDYASLVMPYVGQPTLDAKILAEILNRISLRDFVFLEYDNDYFEEVFEETIRIAKERGRHQ